MFEKLINAIRSKSAEKVQECLNMGADPNSYEDQDKISPLHFVAQRSSIQARRIAQLLLEAGANPLAKNSPDDQSPIDIALAVKHFKMAYVLGERRADFQ